MENVLFISCIRFSMQLLISEYPYTTSWKKRKAFGVQLVAGLLAYLLAATVVYKIATGIPFSSPVVVILYYLALFGLSLGLMQICFETTWEELLFAGVCGYATQHIAFACVTIVTQLAENSFNTIEDFLFIRLLPYVCASAIAYFGLIRRNAGQIEFKKRDIRQIWLAFGILSTVIIISVLVDYDFLRKDALFMQNVFCKIYAITCSIFAIFIAFFLSRQNHIQHENEIMESMLHNIAEQQMLSQETINLINIKCHDLKYRISKIPSITDEKDQLEYINSVKDTVAIYDNIFQTGNNALDLVLTEKSLRCNEYNIKFSCMEDGKEIFFMGSTDLYALLGNLMDNAIESVLKEENEEKQIISLNISNRNGGCHLHLENYCTDSVEFVDGLPVTTKADKDYHGFGVRSIRYITQKYYGDLLMRSENNRFLTDIIFYQDL